MSEVFKVCHLNKSKITKIFIFYGKHNLDDGKKKIELNELFNLEPENAIFNDIFNKDEIQNIKKNNIPLEFIEFKIHIDDTIEDVKKKIILAQKKLISFDEIYLFGLKKEKLNPVTIYQNLTLNDKLELTQERLIQFLLNFTDIDIDSLEKKSVYDFEDLLDLDFSIPHLIKKPIGQTFIDNSIKYLYTVNPFDVITYDTYLEEYIDNIISTKNSSLLLDFGTLEFNSLYLTNASDVFTYNNETKMSEKFPDLTSKIYFPFLFKNNIKNIEELKKNNEKLLSKNNKLLNKSTIEKFESVDLFYQLSSVDKIKVNNSGITNFEINIFPDNYFNMPLDIIFKLLHSKKTSPLIKFNPGNRKEKIYRLYSEEISSDGRRIPFINKALIFKLMKNIGKTKTVTVYLLASYKGNKFAIICEINNKGIINVKCDENNISLTLDELTEVVKDNINPIILLIQEYIEQSGYKLNLISSLYDNNIEIVNFRYNTNIPITKNINLSKFSGCVSSIFNVLDDNLKKGIFMRFKRVSNFNIMNSQQATIIELVNKGLAKPEILNILIQNFSLTPEEAESLFLKFLSEIQVERGLYENKKLKIKENPGFLTSITLDKFQSNITISMDNINNIYYLEIIPTYLNSLIVLTEGLYSVDLKANVSRLCKKKKVSKEKIVKDIIAPQEKKELQEIKTELTTRAKEFKFDEDEQDDDFLDMLLDDDEEEESQLIGGADSIEFGDSIESASPSPEDEPSVSMGDSIESASPSPEAEVKPPSPEDESSVSMGDSIESASPSPEPKVKPPSPEDEPSVSMGDSIESASPSPEAEVKPPSPEDEPSVSMGDSIESASPSPKPEVKPPSPEDEPSVSIGDSIESASPSPESEDDDDIDSIDTPTPLTLSKSEEEKIKTKIPSPVKSLSVSSIDSDSDAEEEIVKDITGMQLSNPNYFFNRMEKRDPVLFLKKKQGEFNAYSRMCPSNVRRQPVILTKAELDKIDKEHPGSYDQVIKYGSNPKKQFYYICPRYWCLKDNTSLTQEEVDAGVCGGKDAIIPFGARKVPKGKSIFEFNADSEHKDDDGSYIKHYPGFIPGKKHPDGYCMPCCFKSWDAPQQVERRKECKVIDKEEQADTPDSLVRVASNEAEDYIKGNEKFPLDHNKWGFLPLSIQKFLHTDNKECQISSTNSNIKPFHVCLLRRGVQKDSYQSFIACIADLFSTESKTWQKKNGPIVPTIKEMKQILKKSLTLDSFITLQNSNLIPLFYNEKDVDIDDYETSDLYKNIDTQDRKQVNFMEKAICSYENFLEFLDSNDVIIDYRYLWDLICRPNKNLFEKGLNLIILEIVNDDSTENIELICPTNHYVKKYFDPRKNSLILIKKDVEGIVYYEPIYSYVDVETKFIIKKTFNEYSKLLPNIKIMLGKIKDYINNSCGILPSLPKVYKFRENISLKELIKQLKLINANIEYFVLNFNGKVIGVKVNINKITGFINCRPSSLILNEDSGLDNFKFISDDDIWSSYDKTISFLNYVNSKNKNIPCKISSKIEEDGLIIGFLTETNQFIEINEPIEDIDDGIPIIKNNNFIIADSETILSNDIDTERIIYVKKIKLEKNFYNVFRNTLRILLNKFENRKIRNKVKDIVNAPYILYYDKLKLVIEQLHLLMDNYIDFYDYKIEDILKINTITLCINSDNCEKSWCIRSESGDCKINLPRKNLTTGNDNSEIYFGKLADELIRYNRIKLFIFDPKTFLSFSDIKYNLHENEIILLQSLINQEYFENLIPMINNPFIKSLTFDTANPLLTQKYSKKVINSKDLKMNNCLLKKTEKITGKWSKFLPKNYFEQSYNNLEICTFVLIKNIIENYTKKDISIEELRENLIEEYTKLISELGEKNIYEILFTQGKINMIRQVQHGQLSLENMIMSENYFLTNLDLWILSLLYKVPIIFISSTKNMENGNNILPTFYSKTSNYVIVRAPGIRPGSIPKYKIVTNNDGSIILDIKNLSKKFQQMLLATKGLTGKGLMVKNFIKNFKPIKYVQKKKTKPKLKIETTDAVDVSKGKKIGKKIKLVSESNSGL